MKRLEHLFGAWFKEAEKKKNLSVEELIQLAAERELEASQAINDEYEREMVKARKEALKVLERIAQGRFVLKGDNIVYTCGFFMPYSTSAKVAYVLTNEMDIPARFSYSEDKIYISRQALAQKVARKNDDIG